MTDDELIAGLLALVQRQDAELVADVVVACTTCGATWHGSTEDPCDWCARRRQAIAGDLLQPPSERGYGYATPEDLARLGIDPAAEREDDLRAWVDRMRIAVGAGVITQRQKNDAIRRARGAHAA